MNTDTLLTAVKALKVDERTAVRGVRVLRDSDDRYSMWGLMQCSCQKPLHTDLTADQLVALIVELRSLG